MAHRHTIRRTFEEVEPFVEAAREQADNERESLGFLPAPAYMEAARAGKLLVLVANDQGREEYAGHLLFGGILPQLKVRQTCVAPQHRRQGHATTLLRALKALAEAEGYLSIVANVASELDAANAFYGKNGFETHRQKAGGITRDRKINVRALQLQTPSLLTLMTSSPTSNIKFVRTNQRATQTPLYVVDLNVFFDIARERQRANQAGSVFEAALRQHIRIAVSDEFVKELERKSTGSIDDPLLSFARRLPTLPAPDKTRIGEATTAVSAIVFPQETAEDRLSKTDKSDVLHLSHAIVAGAAAYLTSDSKILAARDHLVREFGLDVVALSEFAELLELPEVLQASSHRASRHFQVENSKLEDVRAFLAHESISADDFFKPKGLMGSENLCVRDTDGIIGTATLVPSRALDEPSRCIICVNQNHAFSSTVADFLISETVRTCSLKSPCHLVALDIPRHPITRRIAISHGFQQADDSSLSKVALGHPITRDQWGRMRRTVGRLCGLELSNKHPRYDNPKTAIKGADKETSIELFDLETLLSPTILSLPKREAVLVPITREFSDSLLGTSNQYSFLDLPEAQFLSRRTYFNTIRAARDMIRGSVIAFYESSKKGGRGAVVAVGRIVEVTSVPVEDVPEFAQRAAVVDDPKRLTRSNRVLVTQFDNLIALKSPVKFKTLKDFGCVGKSNLISATKITSGQLEKIVKAGFKNNDN